MDEKKEVVDKFIVDFFGRQHVRMLKYYQKQMGDQGEDILQEAYYRALKAYRMAPVVQEEFDLWMWKIIRNCFYDEFRREQRKGAALEYEEWMDEVYDASQGTFVDLKKIEEFLMKDPNQKKKEILSDILFGGYSSIEASVKHDKGHDAVRQMLCRFMAKLRAFYQVDKHDDSSI